MPFNSSGKNVRLPGLASAGELLSAEEQPDGSKALKFIPQSSATEDLGDRDASDRLRVSVINSIYDAKQIFNNLPTFWDDQQVSGTGTSSTYNANRSSTTLAVTAATAGKRVRQTFRRYNYESGKSQLINISSVVNGAGTGIEVGGGYIDDQNGIAFINRDGVVGVVLRSYVTGAAVDRYAWQTDADPDLVWNIDTLDGSEDDNNPSGINLAAEKIQVGLIDFEWLSANKIRLALKIDGDTIYFHEFLIANRDDAPFMTTPNLPLRYWIENDGTGGAASIECICASVGSEGGTDSLGTDIYVSTRTIGTPGTITLATANTVYPVLGFKLRTNALDVTVRPSFVDILATTNDDFEWLIIREPTLSAGLTYSNYGGAPIQAAKGDGTITVSSFLEENVITGGLGQGNAETPREIKTVNAFGSYIDGTPDEFVLCVRPFSTNLILNASVLLRELV